MKRFFVATLLLITTLPAFSQVKQLYGETRLGYEAAINGGQYAGNVRADYLNLILEGNIGPNISFFWRQRFTKPIYNPDIPLNATDHLWLRWDINDHWAIQGGKVPIMVGSFEFDAAPINLYYWGMFADRMPDVYAIGGNVICKIAPEQTLFLQFTQSPLGFGYNDLFHAGLIWYGRIAPWWNTIWSVNFVEDEFHRTINYLAKDYLSADYSAILKLEYKFPVVTLFTKGSFDYNKDFAEDFVPVRSRFLTVGGGIEVFPLKNDDIRLHAVYWTNSDATCSNFGHHFAFGITYRLRVIRNLPQ